MRHPGGRFGRSTHPSSSCTSGIAPRCGDVDGRTAGGKRHAWNLTEVVTSGTVEDIALPGRWKVGVGGEDRRVPRHERGDRRRARRSGRGSSPSPLRSTLVAGPARRRSTPRGPGRGRRCGCPSPTGRRRSPPRDRPGARHRPPPSPSTRRASPTRCRTATGSSCEARPSARARHRGCPRTVRGRPPGGFTTRRCGSRSRPSRTCPGRRAATAGRLRRGRTSGRTASNWPRQGSEMAKQSGEPPW